MDLHYISICARPIGENTSLLKKGPGIGRSRSMLTDQHDHAQKKVSVKIFNFIGCGSFQVYSGVPDVEKS